MLIKYIIISIIVYIVSTVASYFLFRYEFTHQREYRFNDVPSFGMFLIMITPVINTMSALMLIICHIMDLIIEIIDSLRNFYDNHIHQEDFWYRFFGVKKEEESSK